jgi:hypothetical protein
MNSPDARLKRSYKSWQLVRGKMSGTSNNTFDSPFRFLNMLCVHEAVDMRQRLGTEATAITSLIFNES